MTSKRIFSMASVWMVALLLCSPVAGQAADMTLKLAYAAPTGSLYDVAAQKFAERVTANTQGSVTIKVFGNSQFSQSP